MLNPLRILRTTWRRMIARQSADARSRFFVQAGLVTPYIGVECGGLTFVVRTDDAGVGRGLFVKRTRSEMRMLDSALLRLEAVGAPPTLSTFLDVGANIGTTSLAALGHGFSAVVACEPDPDNARVLRMNVAANDAEGAATVIETAISDSEGQSLLEVVSANSGKRALVHESRRGRRTILTQKTTLDALVAAGRFAAEDIGFLWIDVEGHEGHVLAGAESLLEQGMPLVMELRPGRLERGGYAGMVVDLLVRHYTHVVDLRQGNDAPLVRVEKLGMIVERVRVGGYTDILACRLRS